MFDFIKNLIAKESTRLVAYGSALAVAGALKLAEALGLTLTSGVLAGVAAISAFIITEAIRHLVYAPATTQKIANETAAGMRTVDAAGNVDIGTPPSGEG